MKRHHKVLPAMAAVAAGLVVAACLVAGCGSEPSTSGSTAASPAASSGAATGPAAMVPEDIRASGELRIGSNYTTPPMEYLEEDGTTLIGMDVDLMNGVAGVLNLTPKWFNINWDGLRPALQSNRFDVVIAAMGDYTDRQAQVTFVDYMIVNGALLVKKADSTLVSSVEDLAGKHIGATRGTSAVPNANKLNKDLEAQGLDPMIIDVFPDDAAALLALRSGRVFGFVTDITAAAYQAKTADDGNMFAVALPDIEKGAPFGIAVNKDDLALAQAIEAALNQMIADGSYKAILDKWVLGDAALESAAINGGTTSSE